MRRATPFLARLACDLPVLVLLTVWVGSYWWSVWVTTTRGAGMVIDRGACLFATRGFDDDGPTSVHLIWDVNRSEPWEDEYGGTHPNRWLPVRRIELPVGQGQLYIVALWAPTALAAGLAWWGGRRRRSKARGFAVESAGPQ